MNTPLGSKHKNTKIFDALRDQIETSVLKPGDRLQGERQLSELYNCSRPTVRKSLRKLESLKLVERVRGSGTYVSKRIKKKKLTKTIGILAQTDMADSSFRESPYLLEIIDGLHRDPLNNNCNFRLLIMSLDDTIESFFENNDLSIEDFDGLLCFLYNLSDEDVETLKNSPTSFVTTIPPEGDENISYVAIDNGSGIYEATTHLLSLGRKKPYFLSGSLAYGVNQERLKGFQKGLKKYGIEYDDNMYYEILPSDHKLSTSVVKELCNSRDQYNFDAMVICGDWATYGAYQAIKKAGLRIPEDIAIVMYDDMYWVQRILEPHVTAVKQPFMNQAKRMLRLLLNQIDDKEEAMIIETIKPQLIIRESCGSSLTTETETT